MGVFPLPIETFGHSNDAAAKDDDPGDGGVSESRPRIWIGLKCKRGKTSSFKVTIFKRPCNSVKFMVILPLFL